MGPGCGLLSSGEARFHIGDRKQSPPARDTVPGEVSPWAGRGKLVAGIPGRDLELKVLDTRGKSVNNDVH